MVNQNDLSKLHETVQIGIGTTIKLMDGCDTDIERLKLRMILNFLRYAKDEINDMLPAEKPPLSEEAKILMGIASGLAILKGVQ